MKHIKYILLSFFFLQVLSVFSQFNNDFPPNYYPTQSCNDYDGNPPWEWRPSHGTPNSETTDSGVNTVNLRVKDLGFPDNNVVGEGVFIDLTENLVSPKEGYGYRATFTYSLTTGQRVDLTFRAYLAKNMNEHSKDDCSEEVLPSVSGTQGIFTSNDYLSSGVWEFYIDFTSDSDDYKYLWIYSELMDQWGNDEVGHLNIYRVRLDELGPIACDLSSPNSLSTTNITTESAKINWGSISGNNGYQYAYKKTGSSWVTGTTSSTHKNLSGLDDDSTYYWKVKTRCSNGLYGDYSDIEEFVTETGCHESITITTDVIDSSSGNNQTAEYTIYAENTIYSEGVAQYDAGESVTLKQNFWAKSGCEFKAFIEGCTPESESTKEAVTEKESLQSDKELKIYPNPTNSSVKVESDLAVEYWELMNKQGSVQKRKDIDNQLKQFEIDMSHLPKGMYFLKTIFKDGTVVVKTIVKE